MAYGSRQGPGPSDPEPTGATEPITLTDPDGAVTRVAPWSSWTREQVRAPGGEPALVTRLDQGQLWFSAGRKRSPWRHEVHVGPAVVSTPRGRFQAIAESDGGATIACLAGRTRVVAGLREPVLLGPDQSAAVSSDGRTLVVMDRVSGAALDDGELIDLTDAALAADAVAADANDAAEQADAEVAAYATASVGESAAGAGAGASSGRRLGDLPLDPPAVEPADEAVAAAADQPGPARLGWIPELVAVTALVGLLIAAVWVFTRDEPVQTAKAPNPPVAITDEVTAPPSTDGITTTAVVTTTAATATTAPPPPTASGAAASGELTGCTRAPGGVQATVAVTHRSGPASRFRVQATLVDDTGTAFAEATADTEVVQPGGQATATVLVPVNGAVAGSCELGTVTGIR